MPRGTAMSTDQEDCTDVQDLVDWRRAHQELSRIARERAAHEHEEAKWIMVALRSDTSVHLGYGTFLEYLERLFGYTPRQAEERLRVAECLEDLPALGAALRDGALTWSAVREVTRVATRSTEAVW